MWQQRCADSIMLGVIAVVQLSVPSDGQVGPTSELSIRAGGKLEFQAMEDVINY